VFTHTATKPKDNTKEQNSREIICFKNSPGCYLQKKMAKIKTTYDYKIDCKICYYATRTGSYTVRVSQPSDGLVTQNSASALPGVHSTCVIRADEVNHEELKNHENTTEIFNDIFTGGIFDPRDRIYFNLTEK